MTAEVVDLACAKARKMRSAAAQAIEPVVTSPLVVAIVLCCVPLCLAYLLVLQAAEVLRSSTQSDEQERRDG